MNTYYSIPQAAKICSVSRSTMHRWVVSGKIKSYGTLGGHHRILTEDLKQWIQDNQLPFDIDESQNEKTKILIVDDESSIQEYLKKILNGLLIDIDFASDGFEAGKKIIKFKPDLIILDLVMPNMDGFEVCKNIKQDPSTKNIKVLIMTGYGTKENQEKALSLGADAFLIKPSSKNIISKCVENLLRGKQFKY
jgi:excisionase family DNA binding protein